MRSRFSLLLGAVLVLALPSCGDDGGGEGRTATSAESSTGSSSTLAESESIAPLAATLTGSDEVPGPGDDEGTGSANLEVGLSSGRVCALFRVEGTEPAAAAHIHEAAEGVAGPVVITLVTPGSQPALECVEGPADVVERILADPSAFYVNLHTASFPDGAVRGQLGAAG